MCWHPVEGEQNNRRKKKSPSTLSQWHSVEKSSGRRTSTSWRRRAQRETETTRVTFRHPQPPPHPSAASGSSEQCHGSVQSSGASSRSDGAHVTSWGDNTFDAHRSEAATAPPPLPLLHYEILQFPLEEVDEFFGGL